MGGGHGTETTGHLGEEEREFGPEGFYINVCILILKGLIYAGS